MQRHPFDPRRSGRDPFPCFDAAMQMPLSESDHGSDSDSQRGTHDRDDDGSCACDSADSGGCTCARHSPAASLNWSIDGLATLLPRAFSPLAFQRRASPETLRHIRRRRRWSTGAAIAPAAPTTSRALLIEETPPRSATFFDNEAEFCVLRTPAEVVARERELLEHQHLQQAPSPSADMAVGVQSEYAAWRAAPEATVRWRDLHRRCVDTIELCEARLRERQQRLARLPIPATKLKLKRRGRPLSSSNDSLTKTRFSDASSSSATRIPPESREPLTPVVPTRLSFGSINLSPIPLDSAEKASLDLAGMEPKTPVRHSTSRPVDGGDTGRSVFSSPALSSIAEHTAEVLTPSFASLQFSPSSEMDEEEEKEENKENPDASSSLQTASLLRGSSSSAAVASSSSFSSSSPLSPFSTPPPAPRTSTNTDNHALSDAASISARQQSFLAAIEEEAQARDAAKHRHRTNTPSKDSATEESESDATIDGIVPSAVPRPPFPTLAARKTTAGPGPLPACPPSPATSMASIYREARALGVTEPTAQWEYVQLIRRQTTRERPARTRMSF